MYIADCRGKESLLINLLKVNSNKFDKLTIKVF